MAGHTSRPAITSPDKKQLLHY
jgi:hypothetical protein